jgi:aspartyl-tRNA(Asn)/glutamyl-tRNA(Gln) amidotransferase subunit A
MIEAELIELSASEAIRLLKRGELSADELFATYRERAAGHCGQAGGGLNCFTWLAPDAAREPRCEGVLAGIPLAVKDLFCTEGVPSQAGSRILEGYCPPYTATAVARPLAAGATLLAKTNQDEFAMGSSNENSAFGPVLNPWDRERVPGGSSGGSAAAVSGALAPWAIGTDTGGSIRQPAALCGIVGLKPTYGAVSRYGMIAFASSLDQAGPLTRDVSDAALLFGHMLGKDPLDATSLEFPGACELPRREELKGVRLGVPVELEGAEIEGGVLSAFQQTLRRAEELGADLDTGVQLPHVPHGLAAYYVIAPAEASSNLARYDGVRYGLRVEAREDDEEQGLTGMYMRTRHDGFGSEVKRRVMLGTYALSAGYYEAYYGRAQKVRTKIAEDFKRAFERVDFIVTPTSAEVAFKLGAKSGDPWSMYLNDYFTVPMPLAGLPAISIPCGRSGGAEGLGPDGAGLPVGFQIAGPAFSENALLDVAYALEQSIGFDGSPAWV